MSCGGMALRRSYTTVSISGQDQGQKPWSIFLEIMQKALDYRCVPSILLNDRRAKAQGRRRRTMKKENRDALLFVALEILVGLASLVGWYLGDLVNNLLH